MMDENTCRSCEQGGAKLVCTAGAECVAMSNPEYESWLQISAGAADSHASSPLADLRRLIADDAYAMTFQTFAQYRTALLKAIDAASPRGVAGLDGQTFSQQMPPPPPASGEGEVQPSLAYIEVTPMGIDHGLTPDAYKLTPGIYRLYATPPAGAPAAAVPTLTDAAIVATASKVPSLGYCDPLALVQFARAIERELRSPGAAAQVSENKDK